MIKAGRMKSRTELNRTTPVSIWAWTPHPSMNLLWQRASLSPYMLSPQCHSYDHVASRSCNTRNCCWFHHQWCLPVHKPSQWDPAGLHSTPSKSKALNAQLNPPALFTDSLPITSPEEALIILALLLVIWSNFRPWIWTQTTTEFDSISSILQFYLQTFRMKGIPTLTKHLQPKPFLLMSSH